MLPNAGLFLGRQFHTGDWHQDLGVVSEVILGQNICFLLDNELLRPFYCIK